MSNQQKGEYPIRYRWAVLVYSLLAGGFLYIAVNEHRTRHYIMAGLCATVAIMHGTGWLLSRNATKH